MKPTKAEADARSQHDHYVYCLILNWIRWELTRPEVSGRKPINLGYGRNMLDIGGAQSGVRDGERQPVPQVRPIESLALKVDALWWKRTPAVRRMLSAWYFGGKRIGGKAGYIRQVKAFEADVKRIEL